MYELAVSFSFLVYSPNVQRVSYDILGHVDIQGNKRADIEAKAAANSTVEPYNIRNPFQDCKRR